MQAFQKEALSAAPQSKASRMPRREASAVGGRQIADDEIGQHIAEERTDSQVRKEWSEAYQQSVRARGECGQRVRQRAGPTEERPWRWQGAEERAIGVLETLK